jgi:hypothetical protein
MHRWKKLGLPPLGLICNPLENVCTLEHTAEGVKGALDLTTNLVAEESQWEEVSEHHE